MGKVGRNKVPEWSASCSLAPSARRATWGTAPQLRACPCHQPPSACCARRGWRSGQGCCVSATSRATVLVAGHKPEGQGKATKAYLDLQRKQFKKKKNKSILGLAVLKSLMKKLLVLSPVLYLLVRSRSEEVCIFVILQYLPLCKCC